MFDNAKWIWINEKNGIDEYGEFYSEFLFYGRKTELIISADTNYAVYLNGELSAFGQYSDYPYDKVYDRVDITEYCRDGNNSLAIIVWYWGIDTTQVYYPGTASVIFEVLSDGKSILSSGSKTLSRKSRAYVSHKNKIITSQLGPSFEYDAQKEDSWMLGDLCGFSESTVLDVASGIRPRPNQKLRLLPVREASLEKKITSTDTVWDIGINTVGFLYIDAECPKNARVTVAYGEHIADGAVRRVIGNRDFSVQLALKEGKNVYLNPFRRLGAKYLEVISDVPIYINRIGITPTEYPVNVKPTPDWLSPGQREIYDICVRTLLLCIHEHYEDCPWREQALYCMDSRNQMLCGYYAFGEYELPRSSLELISKEQRSDNLLGICYPMKRDYAIPSFSLHYFTECREYFEYSGDIRFIGEIYPKLKSILSVFLERLKSSEGLVLPFEDTKRYWNFYEWTEGLARDDHSKMCYPDIILNTLLSLALSHMSYISDKLNIENEYENIRDALNEKIKQVFYSDEQNEFYNRPDGERQKSILGNSLAILAGVIDGESADRLCDAMIQGRGFSDVSLSMRCFFYDALIKVDKEKYSSFILSDIERIYRPMVDLGVGTVWETELGESDFFGAGSLCHGWSAMPVYYYHTLKDFI